MCFGKTFQQWTPNLNDTNRTWSMVGSVPLKHRQLRVTAVLCNYHIRRCKSSESTDLAWVLTASVSSWHPCAYHHSLTRRCYCHRGPKIFEFPWRSRRGFFPALLKINLTFSWNNRGEVQVPSHFTFLQVHLGVHLRILKLLDSLAKLLHDFPPLIISFDFLFRSNLKCEEKREMFSVEAWVNELFLYLGILKRKQQQSRIMIQRILNITIPITCLLIKIDLASALSKELSTC